MSDLFGGTVMGFPLEIGGNSTARSLNAAATWQAYSFIAKNKTLASAAIYQTSKAGTVATTDIAFELQADSGAGIPSNTALETRNPTSIPASAGRLEATGFTTALTEGAQYWIVIKNLNGVPGTNNISVMYHAAATLAGFSNTAVGSWGAVGTQTSGAAWATNVVPRTGGLLVGYSDSTWDGMPSRGYSLANVIAGTASQQIYGTRAHGVKFNGLVSGITYRLGYVQTQLRKVGSPNAVRCRIYNASGTLVATSRSVPAAQVTTGSGGNAIRFEFTTPAELSAAGAPYRALIDQESAGGSSANYYTMGFFYCLDTSAEAVALGPMNGTWCHGYTQDITAGTPTWVDTTDTWPLMALGLAEPPFLSVSAGGVLLPRPMNGGYSA